MEVTDNVFKFRLIIKAIQREVDFQQLIVLSYEDDLVLCGSEYL
jgi:hypothetical protein